MKKRLASRECRSIADIGNEVVLALDARAVLRDVGINSWIYGNLLLKKIDYGMFFSWLTLRKTLFDNFRADYNYLDFDS